MIPGILRKLIDSNASRWVVLALDLVLSLFSFSFATFVTYTLNGLELPADNLPYVVLLILMVRTQAFLLMRSYQGVLKYTSTQDAVRLSFAILLGSFAAFLFSIIYQNFTGIRLIPLSVQIIDFFVLLATLTSVRLTVKIMYRYLQKDRLNEEKMVIFGAGESGLLTKRAIDGNANLNYRVVAFFDDDIRMHSKTIEGVRIHQPEEDFDKILDRHRPTTLIIAARKIPPKRLQRIVNSALSKGVKVKRAPSSEKWINGEFQFSQIESVKIEDLLGRDPIVLHHTHIGDYIQGKVILITGAAGSIGSELARQALPFSPGKLILLDQAETPLHDLGLEFENFSNVEVVIADICNEARMRKVFEAFEPEVVFHAAAYKHVPLMEDNPYEAVHTNVFGTRIVANLAVEFNVSKFVFISTDKAVNPTNIMGATKRIAELYTQSLNHKLSLDTNKHTLFITTRFGNVLGSNGSVIPLFKKQIDQGGPVTVTHPEITRYFMTIPEACQLVLEAGAMGSGGEIFIFDMGESVKIIDLAKRMIELSGLIPGKDIEIVYTGLRPGEKLKEELLASKENTIGTYNPKIMIAQVSSYNYLEMNQSIEFVYQNRDSLDNVKLVSWMKTIVPEYVSMNSVYEKLDKSRRFR